eukprot:TRINITY_DN77294_c0_g1_i1.p1 TRINITY_DN77294_c0_g1~~TRINITY_DN77294_c0_g1_i1.p1  ORF type:complete len:208 (+),score=67.85 TRINITY_DN77294_c0_g1_i1:76-624(+)
MDLLAAGKELADVMAQLSRAAGDVLANLIDSGGTKDQLRAAALKVKKATLHLEFDDTPKGKLNKVAKDIAEAMKMLSDAAISGDKAGIIRAARMISDFVAKIIDNAKQVSATCKDKKTANELMSMAYAAKNFAVQLKILAAVKASIDGTDPTAETQLVTCANGVANAVVKTIANAEVAQLKS